MRRTSVGKYHIRLTLQILTIGSDMVAIELLVPPRHAMHQGAMIPRPQRHNAMFFYGKWWARRDSNLVASDEAVLYVF